MYQPGEVLSLPGAGLAALYDTTYLLAFTKLEGDIDVCHDHYRRRMSISAHEVKLQRRGRGRGSALPGVSCSPSARLTPTDAEDAENSEGGGRGSVDVGAESPHSWLPGQVLPPPPQETQDSLQGNLRETSRLFVKKTASFACAGTMEADQVQGQEEEQGQMWRGGQGGTEVVVMMGLSDNDEEEMPLDFVAWGGRLVKGVKRNRLKEVKELMNAGQVRGVGMQGGW